MEYRQLGRTGTRVSKVCLGTMGFGPRNDEQEAAALVDAAIDSGINFIDTADCYTTGVSEEYLGKALKANGKRDDVVLATKAVAGMGPGPNDHGASRYHLSRAVEASLKRLRTDRIDLFYLHIVDITTPLDEVLDQLDILVRQGKILYVGTSKWPVPLIMEALWIADKCGYPRIVAEQSGYNIADRRIESQLVWTCLRHGIAICPWGPLATGMLAGVYRKDRDIERGHRFPHPSDSKGRLNPEALDLIEALIPMAEARGVPLAEFSLAWIMQRPGITSPVVGARTIEHLEAAVRATDIQLTQQELDRIDELQPPGEFVSSYYATSTQLLKAVNGDNPYGY